MTEVQAVLREKAQHVRTANLRAGTIAATIANVHRRKGTRSFKATDFLEDAKVPMEMAEAVPFMDSWMSRQNAVVKRRGKVGRS